MLYWLIKGNEGHHLFESQLKHAILRNFGGGSLHDIDPVHEFEECFRHSCVIEEVQLFTAVVASCSCKRGVLIDCRKMKMMKWTAPH